MFLHNNNIIEKIDLLSELRGIVDDFKKNNAYDKKIQFKIDESNAINKHMQIKANRSLFKRSIENIFTNSIKSFDEITRDNYIIIISMECTDTHVELNIHDNGCGITSDDLFNINTGKIFTRFNNGSGIGLFFLKQNIEEWNGSIQYLSKVGLNTTVKITFPLIESN